MVRCLLLVFMGVLSMSDSQFICESKGENSEILKCSNEEPDYILYKGEVPANNKTLGIFVKDCKILDLRVNCFHGITSLIRLDLSYNRIKRLKLGVFDHLTRLKRLDLSDNLISDFPAGLLDKIENLETLDLTTNHLLNINPGAFKNIRFLYLFSNDLQGDTLNPKAFGSSAIEYLHLDRNDLEGAPEDLIGDSQVLVALYLEECSLMTIPKFLTAQKLDQLYLGRNKMSNITDLARYDNLQTVSYINLGNNLIEELDGNGLATLKRLRSFDLSENRIKTIAIDTFRNTPFLMELNLSSNFITTLPAKMFKGTMLTILDLSKNRLTFLQENFLGELKNLRVPLRKFSFDKNPWQCACLRELLRELLNMYIIYDSSRFDGRNAVCVTSARFVCHRDVDNEIFADFHDIIIKKICCSPK